MNIQEIEKKFNEVSDLFDETAEDVLEHIR